MTQAQLIVVLHEDLEQGGYWAEVPFMEGCVSEGDTLEETLENISEATAGVLEDMMERVLEGNAPGFPSLPEGFSVDSAEQGRQYGEAVLTNYPVIRDLFASAGIKEPASEASLSNPKTLFHTLDVKASQRGVVAVST